MLENILGVLESESLSAQNIIKTTVFLANMDDFVKFNGVYEKFVKAPYPARSTVQVAKLPKAALVEIETIAFKP